MARRRGHRHGPPPRLRGVPAGRSAVLRERLRRVLFTRVVARTYDLFLGVGTLTLDYLGTCGVPRGEIGALPLCRGRRSLPRRSRLSRGGAAAAPRAAGRARPARCSCSRSPSSTRARRRGTSSPRCRRLATAGVWIAIAGDGPERAALERAALERGLERGRTGCASPATSPTPSCRPSTPPPTSSSMRPARSAGACRSARPSPAACRSSPRRGSAPATTSSTQGGNGFRLRGRRRRRAGEPGDRPALALTAPASTRRAAQILARWDYAATWRGLLSAAAASGSAERAA